MTLLESIDDPARIRTMDEEQLAQLCTELRQYIIACCAENPGHIGASLGAVEIAVAIHHVFNTPEDKVVWDVGHPSYSYNRNPLVLQEYYMCFQVYQPHTNLFLLELHIPLRY